MTVFMKREHGHAASIHEYQPDGHGATEELELRNHMIVSHDAASGWAAFVDSDLLFEVHNRDHGLDALGGAL